MELCSSVIALVVMISWAKNLKSIRQIPIPTIWLPLLLFSAVLVVGVVLGDAALKDQWHDIRRIRFFLLFFVLYEFLRTRGDQLSWVKPLACITAVIGVYGFFQHFFPLDIVRSEEFKIIRYALQDEKVGPLVLGVFNHHLTFASIFAFYACLFMAFGVGLWPRHRWSLFLGILLGLDWFWTQSRTAWFAIPIAVLVIMSFKSRRWVMGGLAACALLALSAYSLDPGFRGRLDRAMMDPETEQGIAPRARLWKVQLEIFKEHPWFGIGYNNNERQAEKYMRKLYPEIEKPFLGHAHSTPLQILATMGIFGTIGYLWFWSLIFKSNAYLIRYAPDQSTKWLAVGLLAGFISFHIQSLTQWNFGDAEVLHNLIFFWAVLLTQTQRSFLRISGGSLL